MDSSIMCHCCYCDSKVFFPFDTFIGNPKIWNSDDLIPIEILAKVHGNIEICPKCLKELCFKVKTKVQLSKVVKQEEGE